MQGHQIRELINMYGLKEDLLARMSQIRKGGIAWSTFYKACDRGPVTPLLRLILETAQQIIQEHIEHIEKTQQPQPDLVAA